MKDILRQPDGKIRTACKFCRQRKKRCSGEMPCASCVNFNRDCCVYERWTSSPASSVPKLKDAPATLAKALPWVDQQAQAPSTPPTKPCFTSRVVLRQIQNQKNTLVKTPEMDKDKPNDMHSFLQSPFQPSVASPSTSSKKLSSKSKSKAKSIVNDENTPPGLNMSSFASPSPSPPLALPYHNDTPMSPPFDSPMSYMSMPLTPIDAMTRTISLPAFYDRSWTMDNSPPLFEPSNAPSPLSSNVATFAMSKTLSMPLQWSQPSTPSSLSTPPISANATDDVTAMLSPEWYPSSCDQHLYLPGLLPSSEQDTKQLLQDVDALLLEYGNSTQF